MDSTAEVASQNGEAKKVPVDQARYRAAVKATMKKREPGSDGVWRRVEPSEEEVERFLFETAMYGLNPLAGQIYATWEDGVMKTVAHIDGLRLLAERTGLYDGQEAVEWCDQEGNWTDYWAGNDHPLAARVRVYKKGARAPTTGTANWHDFAPKSTEGAGALWSSVDGMPAHMLGIRAEALALRKAFPSELSGLYTAEELEIAPPAEDPGPPAEAQAPAPPEQAARPAAPAPERSPAPEPEPERAPVPAPERPPEPVQSAGALFAAPEPASPPPGTEPGPAAIVDSPASQPSGAPALPGRKRSLAEAVESAEYARLRVDLVAALFDQTPERLSEQQREEMAALLAEAGEAAVTPVELERACKVMLREGDLQARVTALRQWVGERARRAAGSEPS